MTSSSRGDRFRELHRGPRILVMPNAWDVASARVFEEAGAAAIATTSAGIAFAHGFADGERIPVSEMMAVVARIARAVRVPVTADLESGYGKPAETALKAIAAGAVGMNFEDQEGDALIETERQQESIRAIRDAVPQIFLNARVDVYLGQFGDPASRFTESVKRAIAYAEAGADSIFVPGVQDEQTIADLVRAIPAPLNVLVGAGSPSVHRLEELGVRRVTAGSAIARVSLYAARKTALELLERGTYCAIAEAGLSYDEINEMLSRGR